MSLDAEKVSHKAIHLKLMHAGKIKPYCIALREARLQKRLVMGLQEQKERGTEL